MTDKYQRYSGHEPLFVAREGDVEPAAPEPGEASFHQMMTDVINSCCMENASNTPDYILADYLSACLQAFNAATLAKESWHGREVKDAGAEPLPTSSAMHLHDRAMEGEEIDWSELTIDRSPQPYWKNKHEIKRGDDLRTVINDPNAPRK